MFDWFKELDRPARHAFWACCGGYALDAMDVLIFSFILPILVQVWGISSSQAGLLASSTLLCSALGGWGAGVLADRIGRVRTLQLTVLWFAIFTILSGFTTNFDQLLVTRSLEGLGFGGEWAAGSVLIAEVTEARHRGRSVGFVQSCWALGWGAAALLATVAQLLLPPEWAWRALFVFGGLPGLLLFATRRTLPRAETPDEPGGPILVGAIFGKELRWWTLRASLLAFGIHGGYYAITTWLPTILRNDRHLGVGQMGVYLAVIVAGSFCGYLSAATSNDMLGRRKTFVIYSIGAAVMVVAYADLHLAGLAAVGLGFPLGFFSAGVYTGLGPLLSEVYPRRVRGAGQGFCYSAGRGAAAIFPLLIGFAADRISMAHAMGLLGAAAYCLTIASALSLPETSGSELRETGAFEKRRQSSSR